MHDTVDDGRGGGRIQEHLGPAGERQIGCDDEAPALVAAADEAEQQVALGKTISTVRRTSASTCRCTQYLSPLLCKAERRDISALDPCCRTACIRDLIAADDALGASRSGTLGH